ncbi:c-type cytochrome [Aneurinibacillus migulanus]|uniref:Cytochrome C n=1 Tax=Aneurinibacillus migulanus TaxID=47500 RepID=A0A0D1W6I4_ANEMI|nr:c-type cytochrome [Aneurinibacillus migulanus]KIV54045.1 cytochrome C [Aneurinibacillus migulanus]KON97712.1 cytochrome C [Aneurinibacillus migulanus]MED0894482.1 c-type cytochrome [Aneurinibacillus migulanus]MED1617092.1 c-type cytochrome [Aneurinibacillus migulanus]SDJ33978.1 Cytochrome c [Aneurinibacillus migulanus]
MGKNIGVFVLFFALAFGGGYLFYQIKSPVEAPVQTQTIKDTAQTTQTTQTTTSASKEGEVFTQKGCISCHSVSKLGIKGGEVGPDLSKAYATVPDKHGVPIDEFLKKPTTAVMSGVIGKNPLTDDERKAIIAALKAALEK